MSSPHAPISLTGTFDLEPLRGPLEAWRQRFGWDTELVIRPAASDPGKLVNEGLKREDAHSINFLIVRPSDWPDFTISDSAATRSGSQKDSAANAFASQLLNQCGEAKHNVIVLLAPPEDATGDDAKACAKQVENHLFASLSNNDHVHVARSPEWMGSTSGTDGDQIPLYPALAMIAARFIHQAHHPAPKLLIVHDHDTLWKESPTLEKSDPIKIAAEHRELQRALASQRESGALIAVLSDGPDHAVKRAILDHPDMILKADDIVDVRRHSTSAREAVELLAKQLGIPGHHVAFLSKSADLVTELRKQRSDIISIVLPENANEIPDFLGHLWLLDRDLSNKDMGLDEANKQLAESKRRLLRQNSRSFADYVEALDVKVTQVSPTPEQHARMAELTSQATLFNATARRFSESEIKTWLRRPYHYATLFRVQDIHSDLGVVGLIMFERVKRTLLVHNFLLDDIAAYRGVENRMLADLSEIATQHNCLDIDLPFLSSEDNRNTQTFLDQMVSHCRQDLPEEGWSVFQVPIKLAKTLGDRDTVELKEAYTSPLDTEGHVAPSEAIQRIASTWRTLSQLDHQNSIIESEASSCAPSEDSPLVSPFIVVSPPATDDAGKESAPAPPDGPFALSPIQSWFFHQNIEGRDHWNNALMLQTKKPLDCKLLERSLTEVSNRHAIFRLKFHLKTGEWRQEYSKTTGGDLLRVVDLRKASDNGIQDQIETIAAATQGRLNIRQGALLRAVYFDLGAKRPARLLLVAHQLVIDSTSWGIFLKDLATDYEARSHGADPQFPAKTASYATWLEEISQVPRVAREAYMDVLADSASASIGIPADFENPGRNIEGSQEQLEISLDEENSKVLLSQSQPVEAILAASLAHTFQALEAKPTLANWTWEDRKTVTNVSQTIGWCEQSAPILLSPSGSFEDTANNLGKQLETLQEIHGIGNPDTDLPAPWMSFRHRKATTTELTAECLFQPSQEAVGALHSPRALRSYKVVLESREADGKFVFRWSYSRHLHKRETIENLANKHLSELQKHLASKHGALDPDLNLTQRIIESPFTIVSDKADGLTPKIKPQEKALTQLSNKIPSENSNAAVTLIKEARLAKDAWLKEEAHRAKEARLAEEERLAKEVHLAEEAHLLNQAAEKVSRPALLIASENTNELLNTERVTLAKQLPLQNTEGLQEIASILATSKHTKAHRSSMAMTDLDQTRLLLNQSINTLAATPQPPTVFLFPDSWAAHPLMGKGLYECEATFREVIDWCGDTHRQLNGHDLRETLFDPKQFSQTSIHTDAAVFAMEFALARLWMSWGVYPDACLGQGIGEYVAACLGGVFTIEEGLALIAKRAELISKRCPEGRVLKVNAPAKEVKPFLKQQVDVAAYQSTKCTLITGPTRRVEALEEILQTQGIAFTALGYSTPRQSNAMDVIEDAFETVLSYVDLQPTQIPFISGVTGDWVMDEAASAPTHWISQLSKPLRISEGLNHLEGAFSGLALEVGPGDTLTDSLKQSDVTGLRAFSGTTQGPQDEMHHIVSTLGKLWEQGVPVDWHAFHGVDTVALSKAPSEETEPGAADTSPEIQYAEPASEEKTDPPTINRPPLGAQAAAQLLLSQDPLRESSQEPSENAPIQESFEEVEIDQTTNDSFDSTEESNSTTLADLPNNEARSDTPPSAPDSQEEVSQAPSNTPLGDPAKLHCRFEQIENALDDLRSAVFPSTPETAGPEDAPLPAGIADYMEEVNARIREAAPQSQQRIASTKALLGEPASNNADILIIRQLGGQAWDADERNYVDISPSVSKHLLGYSAPEILKAYRHHLQPAATSDALHALKFEVSKAISSQNGSDRVTFTQSSADALSLSFMLAKEHSNRPAIGLVKPNQGGNVGHCLTLPANASQLTSQIYRRRRELAAIVVNPLDLIQLEEDERTKILQTVREETERWNIAFILDERDTAFRWNILGHSKHAPIKPDIVIYGEPLADGLPLGIVSGNAEWFDGRRSTEDEFATLSNTLPLVAAHATLNAINRASAERIPQWQERTTHLLAGLKAVANELDAPLKIRRLGALFTLEPSSSPDESRLFEAESLLQGVRLSTSAVNATTLSHTEQDLARVHNAFIESFHALQDRGFLLVDFAAYQARLAGKKDKKLLGYWENHLTGAQGSWPADYVDKSEKSQKTLRYALPTQLAQALDTRAKALNGQYENLLLACFQRLFQAWSGTDRIAFLANIEGVNTPLCSAREPDTINQSIERICEAKELAIENTLFQPETFVAWLANHGPTCGFSLDEIPEELAIHWQITSSSVLCDYDASRYHEDTIARWMDCFIVLLEGFATMPMETLVEELPLVSSSDFQNLVISRNLTTTGSFPNEPVHKLFESVAAKTPSRIAVRYGHDKLCYGDLNTRADQLAAALLQQGVDTGDTIAVLAEPSPLMLEAWLAILKVGAAYLPLDPQHRADPDTLKMAQVKLLLSDQPVSDSQEWTSKELEIQDLNLLSKGIQPTANETPTSHFGSLNASATVLFDWTKQSSAPVSLPHRSLVRLVKNTDYATLSPHEVFLLGGSPSSDRCLLEVWGALLNGGVLAIPQGMRSTANLAETIGKQRVSSLVLTSEELTNLMERHAEDLSWIRQIVITDKRPAREIVARILEELPVSLTIGYGSLYNSLLTCCHTITEEDLEAEFTNLGSPIPHTQIYLLNEAHQPVPTGMTGDVWVGGDGLALFQDTDQRKDVVKSRFTPSEGVLFHTGTRAMWHEDGSLILAKDGLRSNIHPTSNPLSVTPLSTRTTGQPIFFIAASPSDKDICQEIADSSISDRPAYLIVTDFVHASEKCVESMAEACLAEIRSRIGGESFIVTGGPLGGTIAYEVGQQAMDQGDSLDSVALFDTINPAAEESEGQHDCPPLQAYVPRAYQGAITLFRHDTHTGLHQLGWDGLVRGGMTVISTRDTSDVAAKFKGLLSNSTLLESP